MTVSFTSTALMGTNKAGILKPNSDGYYEVVLGGFEVYNGHGDYYDFEEQTKQLFEKSSSFMRMVQAGNLWGEYAHPKLEPGESMLKFVRRCLLIDELKTSHHIADVRINKSDVKDANGKPIIAVIGDIKPMGPYGSALKEVLDNKRSNCCFSVRAQTEDRQLPNGRECRSTKNIVTWDHVGDPGIETSTKYHAPKLESFYNSLVDNDILVKLRQTLSSNVNLKMESETIDRQLTNLIMDNRSDIFGGSRQMPRSRDW